MLDKTLEHLQTVDLYTRRILDLADVLYRDKPRQLRVVYFNVPTWLDKSRSKTGKIKDEAPIAALVDVTGNPCKILCTSNPKQEELMSNDSQAAAGLLTVLRHRAYNSMNVGTDLNAAIAEGVDTNVKWEAHTDALQAEIDKATEANKKKESEK